MEKLTLEDEWDQDSNVLMNQFVDNMAKKNSTKGQPATRLDITKLPVGSEIKIDEVTK